jgi:hypothetical protein
LKTRQIIIQNDSVLNEFALAWRCPSLRMCFGVFGAHLDLQL